MKPVNESIFDQAFHFKYFRYHIHSDVKTKVYWFVETKVSDILIFMVKSNVQDEIYQDENIGVEWNTLS
jgi:hypothetical protein